MASDRRIPLPSEFNDELLQHPQIEAMLQRCLAYKPSERYSNARVLLAEINKYVATGIVGPGPWPPQEVEESDRVAVPAATREKLVHDATLLLDRQELDRARAVAEQVLEDAPEFLPALLVSARIFAACGQGNRAKGTCRKARQIAPDDPDVFRTMAYVFRTVGKPAMAATMEEQASRLSERGNRKWISRG